MIRPHKSTTHEERYYHVDHDGTVFFRKEETGWRASVVVRDARDPFVRQKGRNAARRKYFQQPRKRISIVGEPSYNEAEQLVEWLWTIRFQHLLGVGA